MQSLRQVLAILPEQSPSTVINVITPLNAMQAAGMIHAAIRLENQVTPSEVAAADVIVLCRNWRPVYRPIFELARQLQIPMIYDLDDHILGAPAGSFTAQLFDIAENRKMVAWLLSIVSLLRVHSPTLKDVLRPYNARIELVSAAIDRSLLPDSLPELTLNPIHIVYAAQRETAEKVYPLMQSDLHALLKQYGDRIHLHFLGYNPPDLCAHPLVTCYPFESDYAAFYARFTRFGYAIGLAPMLDDMFHSSKTNIKFRDYGAAGAAGIYTDTPLYAGNGVMEGETGLLVSGRPGSWLPALTRLIENPALIESIRRNAYHYVTSRYSVEAVTAKWLEHFNALPARPSMSDADRAKLEALRWPFTYERKPDAAPVAWLRNILRDIVPMRWKMRYYNTRHALSRYFRR